MRAGALAAVALAVAVAPGMPRAETDAPRPDSLASVLELADEREPGARVVVSGRLLASDDGRPLAGLRIMVYQADASGDYGHRAATWTDLDGWPARDSLGRRPDLRSFLRQAPVPRARLSGWLVSDSLGRYEIRTVRPGAYASGGAPHIHFEVDGHDFVVEFDRDRRREEERRRSQSKRASGDGQPDPGTRAVERVVRDFRVPG